MSLELEHSTKEITHTEAASESTNSTLLAFYVAVGLTYTWYAISFLMFGVGQNLTPDSENLMYYSPTICALIGILTSYMLVPRLSVFLDYGKRKSMISCLFGCVTIGILLLFIGIYGATFATELLVPLGCFVLGTAIGAIGLLCKEFACGLERGFFNMCICISAVVGIGSFCFSSISNPFWQLVIFSIATLLSATAVFAFTCNLYHEDSPEKMPLPVAFKKLDLEPKTGWFLALYGNVLGLKSAELLNLRFEGDFLLLAFSFLGFSAGIVIALVILLKNPNKMLLGQAQRLSFPFLIIGLLPWNLLHEFPVIIGFMWIFAICAVLIFIDFDTHYFLSRKYDVPAIYALTLAFRSFIKGLVVGTLLGVLLSIIGRNQMLISFFGLFFVILLSFLISLIREEPDRSEPEPQPILSNEDMEPVKKTGMWKECCMNMAEDYKLTSRETEILILMLKAMTIEHISSALFISTHTTKTHIYHIYQKMEVKNRGNLSSIFQKRFDAMKNQQRG